MQYQSGAVSGEYYQTADIRNQHKKVETQDAPNRSIMLYHGCTEIWPEVKQYCNY